MKIHRSKKLINPYNKRLSIFEWILICIFGLLSFYISGIIAISERESIWGVIIQTILIAPLVFMGLIMNGEILYGLIKIAAIGFNKLDDLINRKKGSEIYRSGIVYGIIVVIYLLFFLNRIM